MLTRPIPRLMAPLAACVALCALAPAGAVAATASLEGGTFTYSAGAGELNNVRVTVDGAGALHVRDLSAALTPAAGCAADGDGVTCSGATPTRLVINTGDLDDSVDVAAGAVPAEIDGGAGADLLRGGAGADSLRGGAGEDLLDGREGADVLAGGDGADTADYGSRTSAVRVDLDTGPDDGAPGEGDTVVEIENVNGGSGADTLIGAAGANALAGGGGDDTLRGGDGGDTLTGGSGTDAFDGGAGSDVLNSRDASAEQVACGADADTANTDTLDSAAADCEQLTRAAPSGGSVVTPPKLDVSLRRLGNTNIALDAKPHVAVERKRVVAVDITCVATAGRCVGELTLLALIPRSARTSGAVAARRSRPTTVGKQRFDLARGEKRRLRVRISRRSRPRLVDNRVDAGKVVVRQKAGGKRRYAAAKVKIRPTA